MVTDEQPTEQFTARLDPAPEPRRARTSRSFPLWPTIVGVLAVALIAVTVTLVATLNRQDAPIGPAASPTTTPPPTPTTPGSEQPAPPPLPEPRPEAGPNQCVDDLGDGAVDLDTVTLEQRDGELTVRLELATALPAGQSGVGILAERRGKRDTYQVSIGFVDGRLDRYFVWDGDDERELDLDDVVVEGTTITAVFPDDELDRLGDRWRWRAFGTATGSELDSCPAPDQWLEFVGRR